MKRFKVPSILFVMAILISIFPLSAGAQVGGIWNSGFQLANMDPSADANIIIQYYNEAGALAIDPPPTDTIPAGESKTYYLPSISGLADGQYSVVINSSTQVAAVTNLTNYDANMADSYPGFSEGASAANLPLIMRTSNWFSKISIQAVTAAEAYIEFYAGSSTPVLRYPSSGTISIGAGASKTYDISSSAFSALGSSFVGSAVVTASSGSVVALVQEFRTVTYKLVSVLPGSTTAGTKLLAPLVYNDFQVNTFPGGLAWRSGIQVQNVGSGVTYVRLTIKGTTPTGTWTVTKSIQPSASETFFLPSESAVQKDMYGSAVIESCADATCTTPGNGEDIVGIVNTTKYGADVGMAYNAFVDGSATSKISVPLVYGTFQQSRFGAGAEWRSGIQVMNVDSADTYVKVTFTNANTALSGGPWSSTSGAVKPGESTTFYLPTVSGLPIEFYGSAEIEAVNASGAPVDADIIAIVNTTKYVGNFATCYPGINHD